MIEQAKALLIKYKVHIPYIIGIISIFVLFLFLRNALTAKHSAEIYSLKKELSEQREIKNDLEKEVSKKEEKLKDLSEEVLKLQANIDKLKKKIDEKPKPDFTVIPGMSDRKRAILESAKRLDKSQR